MLLETTPSQSVISEAVTAIEHTVKCLIGGLSAIFAARGNTEFNRSGWIRTSVLLINPICSKKHETLTLGGARTTDANCADLGFLLMESPKVWQTRVRLRSIAIAEIVSGLPPEVAFKI